MSNDHPHITMLDLHIHAYLAGTKYAIPTLCTHAVKQYILSAETILSILPTQSSARDSSTVLHVHLNAARNPFTRLTYSSTSLSYSPSITTTAASSPMHDALLTSFVLLWCNTPHREDALRAAALDLIALHLNSLIKLDFFGTLLVEMPALGADVQSRVEEDGFAVFTRDECLAGGGEGKGSIRFA